MIRSTWGHRVAELQAQGWSIRAIAAATSIQKTCIHLMLSDPRYEPLYSAGARFLAFHASMSNSLDAVSGQIRPCVSAASSSPRYSLASA